MGPVSGTRSDHDFLRQNAAALQSTSSKASNKIVSRPKTPGFGRRILDSITPHVLKRYQDAAPPMPSWQAFDPANVALHLTLDPQPATNAVHRRLPEEHVDEFVAIRQQRYHQAALAYSPRLLHGPVPRRTDGDAQARDVREVVERFRLDLDRQFLAPMSREVLRQLNQVQRPSCFRPVLPPRNEILLVACADFEPLCSVQRLVHGLPETEKHALLNDLHRFLLPEQLYALRVLLFHLDVHITMRTDLQQEIHEETRAGDEDDRPATESFWSHAMDDDEQQDASNRGISVTRSFEVVTSGLRGGADSRQGSVSGGRRSHTASSSDGRDRHRGRASDNGSGLRFNVDGSTAYASSAGGRHRHRDRASTHGSSGGRDRHRARVSTHGSSGGGDRHRHRANTHGSADGRHGDRDRGGAGDRARDNIADWDDGVDILEEHGLEDPNIDNDGYGADGYGADGYGGAANTAASGSRSGGGHRSHRRRKKKKYRRLGDNERVPAALWWFGGGNLGRGQRPPTGADLRARKRAEKERNLGFWGGFCRSLFPRATRDWGRR